MSNISNTIINAIESKFQYHELLKNRNILSFYLDKCLDGIDDENVEIMSINGDQSQKIVFELADDTTINLALDNQKIVAVTDGEEAVENAPLFAIYNYGTKIVCDENKDISGDILNIKTVFDTSEIDCAVTETVNGEVTINGSIVPINAILGGRSLYSMFNGITNKSKTTSFPKEEIDINRLHSSLVTYLGNDLKKKTNKTL